jgi:hypothetical protein
MTVSWCDMLSVPKWEKSLGFSHFYLDLPARFQLIL